MAYDAVRAGRLATLLDLIERVTARHLDVENWPRVIILDRRFMAVEDTLIEARRPTMGRPLELVPYELHPRECNCGAHS